MKKKNNTYVGSTRSFPGREKETVKVTSISPEILLQKMEKLELLQDLVWTSTQSVSQKTELLVARNLAQYYDVHELLVKNTEIAQRLEHLEMARCWCSHLNRGLKQGLMSLFTKLNSLKARLSKNFQPVRYE